ncbi:glutamate synthase (NADPH/NADH) small chain [Rhizomicrobium palustre]|uniref:Glutamate synthase (NADPH/NADH) small chain n=1 Tax=Rhizomicrobium palustre TaxID=189966 RepID=A0A846N250_9PROT|nr:glutamate synthase subunit beta [Rhizomicrobium palustre]NIK89207.1 glutamate synthase (NADPH/NADH) small chain [Rhizomicrobium palustre]
MGKATGFLEIERKDRAYEKPAERVTHYHEFVKPLTGTETSTQASRCMDCGIPFCHQGCPVNNIIPDWNDLVYHNEWQKALGVLQSTNNFPEFTGRICPAPCEQSCTLNIQDTPVTIRSIECEIVEKGWEEGWIEPVITERTGKRVAVVGSGPAGLAAAQQLARAGHAVTVFEKNDRIGGLLRYGIPDFKLEKHRIDRRLKQMQAEGVEFRTNAEVGITIPLSALLENFHAVVLAGGAEAPRDLTVEGRELSGVYFAMEFLTQQNKRNAGDDEHRAAPSGTINAKDKKVIVIGGGDTGSDCVGTSNRQGATSVTQIEIMPKPPVKENKSVTWPDWPIKLRVSSSQEEGCTTEWATMPKRLVGEGGKVKGLECVRVEWKSDASGRKMPVPVEGSEFTLEADLVLLAMGFTGPRRSGLLEQASVELDPRGNVKANVEDYKTSTPRVFACGDMRRGQSLVVWAIREGRQAARAVDEFLMGESKLPR